MCYGSGCEFENSYDGECRIRNTIKIGKEFGYSSCQIGGVARCPEEQAYLEENKKELSLIREKIIQDKDNIWIW